MGGITIGAAFVTNKNYADYKTTIKQYRDLMFGSAIIVSCLVTPIILFWRRAPKNYPS